MTNVRECPVLPGYFFRRDGMFSVGTPEGPFWKGYACKLSGKYYRRIKTVDGQSKLVHRMIGFTFCHNPLPEVFTICDHVNGNTEDNSAGNIRWVTQLLNVANSSARNAYKVLKKPVMMNGKRIWVCCKTPRWQSKVTMEGQVNKLGYFDTEQAACDCSRAFRAKRWKEIYMRILKEHEAEGEETPSFDIQHVRPPRIAPRPVVYYPAVQRPCEGRAPRFCCVSSVLPETTTFSPEEKKDPLHKIEIWLDSPNNKKLS